MDPLNPTCEECKGACCETIMMPAQLMAGAEDWMKARGSLDNAIFEVETRCPKLTQEGMCGIQGSEKPKACCEMEVGGALCLYVVSRRRQ